MASNTVQMASNTVQISVARLREGDFLEFKNSAEDQTYRINVVASNRGVAESPNYSKRNE
jgi:hypothetical protein